MAVIDREQERRLVESFVEETGPGVRALLLHGVAGIGKTTLWRLSVDAALADGRRVLVTRPTEAEARLSFAGLADLFGALADELGPGLPAPQRLALERALLRADADEEPTRPLALSLGVLELLRTAATQGPVLLAIDDVPWLDEATAGVLGFALRRLEQTVPVAVLATARTHDPLAPVPAFLADLAPDRVRRTMLSGMRADAIDALLHDALGRRLAPALVRRVHRASAGNPLHAIEIGRALLTAGEVDPAGDALPVPPSLATLLRERLGALSPDAHEVVVHAAALAMPRLGTLAAALGESRARDGAAAATAAGVVVVEGELLRFTHPLLAETALADLAQDEQRALHRRLADVVGTPEEAARHLALATSGSDPDVATALDQAAIGALRRGGPEAAADLAELAAGVTPAGDPGWARRVAAAGRYRLMGGDVPRARALLEGALVGEAVAAGPGRAELLLTLAVVRQLMDDMAAAETLGREALAHAGTDIALIVHSKLLLAGISYVTGRAWSDGARHAADALRLAEEAGDEALLVRTIGPAAAWRYSTGGGLDPSLEERMEQLAASTGRLRVLDRPEFDLAVLESVDGDAHRSSARLDRLVEQAERDADESSLPFLLAMQAVDIARVGAEVARERMERALRLADATGQRTARAHVLAARARLEARAGNADEAWSAAREATALMRTTGWIIGDWAMRVDLAALELGRSDAEAALAVVAQAVEAPADDASRRWQWGAAVAAEALVALGRLEEASVVLDRRDGFARKLGSRRLAADARRARARLEAAAGNVDAALASIADAEAVHREMGDGWELARTLLVAGEIHRRARRRARAREALSEAAAAFEAMGARRWAEQAREQLSRIGAGRTEDGLTPTQREVAELAATGLTNREIGDRLFMSAHTVEAHLSAVYRSLGIRSRVEIEGALAAAADPARDSSAGSRDSRPGTHAKV